MEEISVPKDTLIVAMAAMKQQHKLNKRMLADTRNESIAAGYIDEIDRLEFAIAVLTPRLK